MNKHFLIAIVGLMFGLCSTATAGVIDGGLTPTASQTFGFNHIVEAGDGPTQQLDGSIGVAQLTVNVFGWTGTAATNTLTTDKVLFVLTNSGSDASRISEVYFDDGALLGITDLIDSDDNSALVPSAWNVDFSEGSASPPELPAGNTIGFETTAGFLADTDSGQGGAAKGVDPGEELGVIFDLQGDLTVLDVIASMNDAQASGLTLNIGVHVTGFASGGSEGFVTNLPEVPEPTSLAIWGLGVLGLAGVRRRRKKA